MERVSLFTEQVTLYLTKEQKMKLKLYSFLTSRNMNDIIRDAIEEYMRNHPIKSEELQKLL